MCITNIEGNRSHGALSTAMRAEDENMGDDRHIMTAPHPCTYSGLSILSSRSCVYLRERMYTGAMKGVGAVILSFLVYTSWHIAKQMADDLR
jgi:hypothetical protein